MHFNIFEAVRNLKFDEKRLNTFNTYFTNNFILEEDILDFVIW